MPDVVVVGAGLSGLTAARRLAGAGVDVEVLEARDRVGGKMHSVQVGGLTADLGAHWVRPSARTRPLHGCGVPAPRHVARAAPARRRPRAAGGNTGSGPARRADPGRVRETAPALLHVLFYMQSAGGMEGAIDAGERAAAEILSLRPRRSVR